MLRVGKLLRFVGALVGGGNAFDAVEFTPYDSIVNVRARESIAASWLCRAMHSSVRLGAQLE